MPFEKFEGPFSDTERLGCRNLFCGVRLMLDLFEYKQSGPVEEVKDEGETVPSYVIGLTESSRLWRITFDRPYTVKMLDGTLKRREPPKLNLPAPCCFSVDSEWIREFVFEKESADYIPTHYIFKLIEDFIEIIAYDSPAVEEIANDVQGEGT
jgi:hypothetical protein